MRPFVSLYVDETALRVADRVEFLSRNAAVRGTLACCHADILWLLETPVQDAMSLPLLILVSITQEGYHNLVDKGIAERAFSGDLGATFPADD